MPTLKETWNRLYERIPKQIRNKFAITTIIFMVWMAFFDTNSIWAQYYLQSTLQELETKKAFFLKEIEQAELDQHELFTDDASLEKFARERYLMKKSNEDLFLVLEKDGEQTLPFRFNLYIWHKYFDVSHLDT